MSVYLRYCLIHDHAGVDPCPSCATTTETDLQARLDAHLRSVEYRLNDQRSAVARLVSEATREVREEIEVIKARIADQDAEIARLQTDLKAQAALERTTHQYATATEEKVAHLERRFAGNIADLSFASSRQDEKIKALDLAITTIRPIVKHLVEQPAATSTDCRSETGITVGLIDSLIAIARVLRPRLSDSNDPAVVEALKDLATDHDMRAVWTYAGEAYYNE
jgi:hypothetical protein